MNDITPENIRTYLLGGLDDEDRARIEEKLLTVRSFYDELLIAEDELTDQYLANELAAAESESFERHFLSSPERRANLRFARNLRRYVRREAVAAPEKEAPSLAASEVNAERGPKKRYFFSFIPVQNPLVGYSMAAVVLFAVLGVSWAVFNNLRSPQHQSGEVFLVTLTPGLVRDAGATTSIRIPAGTDSLQLQLLVLADDYQSYRAELLTSQRQSVVVEKNLKLETVSGNKLLRFNVPADTLKHDDYRVKLSGLRPDGNYEDIESYVFRIM